jgi:hypothetical protein
MPTIASLDALERAAAEFEIGDTRLVIEPTALTEARVTATSGTLAVAGNAHTPTGPTSLGLPLGAHVARQRPGVRSIRIKYGSGRFYNLETRRFRPLVNVWGNQVRLRQQRGHLVLDLPSPTEATVPQRPRGRAGRMPASRR